MRRTLRLGSAVILALGIALASPTTRAHAGDKAGLEEAPAFTLPTATGSASLDSLPGEVVLIDFWASWCGPCQQSFPWMKAMHERYGSKGLSIVAINLDKSRKAADDFLVKHPAPFTVAFDPSGKTAKAFHVQGMPTSFLIRPDKTVLLTTSGFNQKHMKELEALIQKACSP